MRVIAGSAGGVRLAGPKHGVRPTMDRVKAAIFSSLGDAIIGARVLDLFAGSGALGLEALSRGAASAVFVESDRDAARAIERNLDKLRLTGATVWRRDALQALAADASAHRKYDLVLVDPPYDRYDEMQPTLAR